MINPLFRSLRQSPTASLLAVLALSLGLGAASALFSLIDHLLLHPVPYPEPARLVSIWRTFPDFPRAQFNGFQFEALARAAASFEAVGALGLGDTTLQSTEGPLPLKGARISGQLLPLLHVQPLLGRLSFTPEEDRLGGPGAVILSHALWRDRFGSDPSILGHSLVLGGRSRTVVGVLPKGFTPPTERLGHPEIYLPIGFRPEELEPKAGVDYEVIGRLKSHRTLAQANEEMKALAATLSPGVVGLRVAPLAEDRARPYRARMALLEGAVLLLLLVACSNASGLLLARQASRRGVLVLQGLLGASPARLIGQVVTEGLGYGALGVLLGLSLEAPLRSFLASQLGLAETPSRPLWVLPAALGLGLASGLAASLLPAWQAAGLQPAGTLRELGAHTSPRAGTRKALVSLEVAFSFLLLSGSAHLMHTLWSQLRGGPGFEPRQLSVCSIALPQDRQHLAAPWARELAQRLGEAPGMEGVCVGLATPIFDAGGEGRTRAVGDPREVQVWYHRMEGDVVAAFGLKLLEGRSPRPNEPGGVLISRPLAQALWPGESALGRQVEGLAGAATVVGIVAGTREFNLEEPLRPQIFQGIPEGEALPSLDLILRSRMDLATLHGQVRGALGSLDPGLAAGIPIPFQRVLADATENQRRAAYPLALLALVSALLSALGLYGLLDQLFRLRRRELGIRAALGAAPGNLSRLVLSTGFRLLLWGCTGGLLGTLALFRLLGHEMPALADLDASALALPTLLLALATALACLGPALRAARMNPADVLRSE